MGGVIVKVLNFNYRDTINILIIYSRLRFVIVRR